MGNNVKDLKDEFSVVVVSPRARAALKDINAALKDVVAIPKHGYDTPWVTLDATVPFVDGKGGLNFNFASTVSVGGPLFGVGWPYVEWEGEHEHGSTPHHAWRDKYDLEIMLRGLTNDHRYVLYVQTYAYPGDSSPQFEVRVADGSTTFISAPFTGRPGQMEMGLHRLLFVFKPLTPTPLVMESGTAGFMVRTHQIERWEFYWAEVYDVG